MRTPGVSSRFEGHDVRMARPRRTCLDEHIVGQALQLTNGVCSIRSFQGRRVAQLLERLDDSTPGSLRGGSLILWAVLRRTIYRTEDLNEVPSMLGHLYGGYGWVWNDRHELLDHLSERPYVAAFFLETKGRILTVLYCLLYLSMLLAKGVEVSGWA
jgi:hypothetical protein